jgi:hypothetical protein
MKIPSSENVNRHAVVEIRAGHGTRGPRWVHRGAVAVWNALPAIGNGASKTVAAISAVLAVLSVASCAF